VSTSLRFFHTISIESINITPSFNFYLVLQNQHNYDITSRNYNVKNVTKKQVKKIEQRIADACKNDMSHTKKLCAESE